jgi:hypothetical protein
MGLIDVQPALDGASADTEIFSDMSMAAPVGGHEDSLARVTQSTIAGGFRGLGPQPPFSFVQRESDHYARFPASVARRIAGATEQSYSEFV